MYSYGPPHMVEQKQDDQLEHTYSSYVRIREVALNTYQRRWTIGKSGERVSGISVLAARHDDDGARGVMVIVVGNGLGDTSSNLDGADCISHSTNTLGKGMNPIILPPAMGK